MLSQSEDLKELAAALSKAQGALENAKQDATNPHLNKPYANLTSIWEAARKPLAENGLAVVQGPGRLDGNVIELTTRLLHSSGQWLESTISLPVSKLDAQQCGSAITYARRYALSAMLGICPDDDDDGHSHSGPRQQEPRREQSRPQQRQRDAEPNPGPQRTQQAVQRQEQPFRPISSPAPPPESNGDKAASEQPKLGLELDAKREEIRERLAEIDRRGVALTDERRQYAEKWAKSSTLDVTRADQIIGHLTTALSEAPADDNPTPAAFR